MRKKMVQWERQIERKKLESVQTYNKEWQWWKNGKRPLLWGYTQPESSRQKKSASQMKTTDVHDSCVFEHKEEARTHNRQKKNPM